MSTVNQDFKVKNGLVVESGQVTLGSVPLIYNATTNKLQIQIDGQWLDIHDSRDVSIIDLDLAVDYNGNVIYTAGGNGVVLGEYKLVNAGGPETDAFSMVFDSGTIS